MQARVRTDDPCARLTAERAGIASAMLPTNTSASVETVSRSGSSNTIAFIAAMDMASVAMPMTSRMTLLNLRVL